MIYLADAIYAPSSVVGQPVYDTLIGIVNPFSVPHSVLIHCIDNSGNEVQGSPLSYTYAALDSNALSFIPNNGEDAIIAPFDGHCAIDFPDGTELLCGACISGGGANPQLPATPLNWNNWSPNVNVQGVSYKRNFPTTGVHYAFAYAIPYYMDPTMHFGPQVYDSSLKLTNKGAAPVPTNIVYHPNRAYSNFGTSYTFQQTIPAGCAVEKQLVEMFPALQGVNNEGWLEVIVQPTALSVPEPASFLAILMISSIEYGQVPVQMGFTLDPYILA